jgi:hypothetical protein
VFVVYCVGSGFCDELITRSEESYRVSVCVCVCVCLIVCDLETSTRVGLGPSRSVTPDIQRETEKTEKFWATRYRTLDTWVQRQQQFSWRIYSPPTKRWHLLGKQQMRRRKISWWTTSCYYPSCEHSHSTLASYTLLEMLHVSCSSAVTELSVAGTKISPLDSLRSTPPCAMPVTPNPRGDYLLIHHKPCTIP